MCIRHRDNLGYIAGSVVGPRFVGWVGNRRAMAAGLLMVAVGGAAIGAILDVRGQALVALVAAFVVLGGGLGVASVASTAQGIAAAGDARAGVASGILNTAAQVGTAVGLAVLVSLAAARTDVLSTTSTQQEALVGGYRWAAAAAMLAGGTGAALLRSRHD
jgi:MFS family permease